jgi:hypothetical protein
MRIHSFYSIQIWITSISQTWVKSSEIRVRGPCVQQLASIINAEGSTILRDPRPGVPINPKRHLGFNETFTIKTCRIRGEKLIDGSRRVYCKIFFKSNPPAEGFIPASDLVVTRASASQEICKIKGKESETADNTEAPGQKTEEITVISKFRRQMMSVLAKEIVTIDFTKKLMKEVMEENISPREQLKSDGIRIFREELRIFLKISSSNNKERSESEDMKFYRETIRNALELLSSENDGKETKVTTQNLSN